MKQLFIILLGVALFIPALCLGAKTPVVAVMELQDKSGKLGAPLLEMAAEHLRSQLVASNRFVVVTKERQMRISIKEQKKESYKECYDKSCQIPLGQALSADNILTGIITKFGKKFTLTVELVDLAKEATVKGSVAEFDGTEDSLADAVKKAVADLTGLSGLPAEVKQEPQAERQRIDGKKLYHAHNNALTDLGNILKYGTGDEEKLKAANSFITSAQQQHWPVEGFLNLMRQYPVLYSKVFSAVYFNQQNQECGSSGGWPCYNAGVLKNGGIGTNADLNRAQQLLQRGCDTAEPLACAFLGSYFLNGIGTEVNYAKAMQLFQKACDGGGSGGCAWIGWMYVNARGVDLNYSRAYPLFIKGCDEGESTSCSWLGWMYENGAGVQKNLTQASAAYQISCDGGEMTSCNNLGAIYANYDKNYGAAFPLFQKACSGGNMQGCAWLGWMYNTGSGVTLNNDISFDYYQKSCNGGYAEACTSLKTLRGY